MEKYDITLASMKKHLRFIKAESAIEALNLFCEKRPNDDVGYQRGGLNCDAETYGKIWASVRTDGGRINADKVTQ